MTKLQYCAGSERQSDVWSDRWDFPKNQPTYNEAWRLVATDLAEDYHSNHDGWEDTWPVNVRIYKDSECVWSGDVGLEMKPYFHVL